MIFCLGMSIQFFLLFLFFCWGFPLGFSFIKNMIMLTHWGQLKNLIKSLSLSSKIRFISWSDSITFMLRLSSILSWFFVCKVIFSLFPGHHGLISGHSGFCCCCSVTKSCPALCDPTDWNTPGLPMHHQLPELTLTHVHWVSDAIQPSHPLSPLLLLPSIFPSIGVLSNESALRIRWTKDWSFSFISSPSNEYSGLISFRNDWLDLLAVQGTQDFSPAP